MERRIAVHEQRTRDPSFTVAVDHGVCCSDQLINDVLRAANEDIHMAETPEQLAAMYQMGHPNPIYRGRIHNPIAIFGQEGIARRDIVAFSRYHADGSFAVYRYGSQEKNWRPVSADDGVLPPYDMSVFPWISELVNIVHEQTGETPNHCIVTRYVHGDDRISAHRDKVIDILPGTAIHSFSFGQPRRFRCRHMDLPLSVFSEVRDTCNGQLLSISYEHNMDYKHEIMPGDGTRISVVLRTCRTRYNPATGLTQRLVSAENGAFVNVQTAQQTNLARA